MTFLRYLSRFLVTNFSIISRFLRSWYLQIQSLYTLSNFTHTNNNMYYIFQGTKCCNYGADGNKIATTKGGYDCVIIPGALKATDSALKSPKICGSMMGLISATGTISVTLCCKSNFMCNIYQ